MKLQSALSPALKRDPMADRPTREATRLKRLWHLSAQVISNLYGFGFGPFITQSAYKITAPRGHKSSTPLEHLSVARKSVLRKISVEAANRQHESIMSVT